MEVPSATAEAVGEPIVADLIPKNEIIAGKITVFNATRTLESRLKGVRLE